MHSVLIELIVFCSAAIIFVPLFTRFGLGSILAYLFAGILVGPMALGFIKDPQVILHFSELGVVFLLFVIGLELAPARLWQLRGAIFGFGTAQVIVTGGILMLIGIGIGLPKPAAFVAGFGLSLSSTAFAAQLLEANRQLTTRHGQGSFGVLMFQDIAVVPILAFVAVLAGGQSGTMTLMGFLKVVAVLAGVTLVGNYAIRHVFRVIAQTKVQEVFIAMALIVVLGTAVLFEGIGLSMGMGAFMAGMLLANSEYRHELAASLTPFKGLLLGLFFIAVGMSLDLKVIAAHPIIVVGVTLGFMALKGVLVYVLGRLFRYSPEAAKNIAFTIPQGGEFAFVLFSVALAKALLTHEQASVLNAAVTLSMMLTPLVFGVNQKFFRRSSEMSERPYDDINEHAPEVIVAGFGRFGQIVARLLRSEFVAFTILDSDPSQVETARRFGNKVYYGDASRLDILESAGTAKAKYFVLAVDDTEKSLEIVRNIKKHFPKVEIIARVRNRQHAIQLMELGVQSLHREMYFTSLEVAKEVLVRKGVPLAEVERRIDIFRRHDEDLLKKQFVHRKDDKKIISVTTDAIAQLEEVLKADRAKNT